MAYEIDDTNYEDMDDLALAEHIEYNHDQAEEFSMDALDIVYGYQLLQLLTLTQLFSASWFFPTKGPN